MSDDLANQFLERIAKGLTHKSITRCSKWAETYRVMGSPYPGPWTFKHHPWLRDMHDAETPFVWGQKSAQMGFTETVLNKTFYEVSMNGTTVLYVLPAKNPDASDFSTSRFDPAVEMSPFLTNLFTDTKNVGHKRAGSASIFVRGSRSRAGLKSIPAGLIILDELEEMTQENIPLVYERAAGQLQWQVWGISTPTIDNHGINALFKTSTQEHFFFKCPHCHKHIELTYPDNLDIEAESLICNECGDLLNHNTKEQWLANGEWVATNRDAEARGFYINQLYSTTVTPHDLCQAKLKADTSLPDEQEFYNSKLGLPHVVKGARVSDTNISAAIGNYTAPAEGVGVIVMGIDVGNWLNYEITEYKFPAIFRTNDLNIEAVARVLDFGKVREFEHLDRIIDRARPQFIVIDAQPERRKSHEFAEAHYGKCKCCFYSGNTTGKQISVKNDSHNITVDRTSWMDAALGRFHTGSITLPSNIDHEYREQIKAPVRVYKKDKNGNSIAVYVEGSSADHYAHARVYSEIALNFAASMSGNYDITEQV